MTWRAAGPTGTQPRNPTDQNQHDVRGSQPWIGNPSGYERAARLPDICPTVRCYHCLREEQFGRCSRTMTRMARTLAASRNFLYRAEPLPLQGWLAVVSARHKVVASGCPRGAPLGWCPLAFPEPQVYLFSCAGQLSSTDIGRGSVFLTGVLIRKRWPSRSTS